MKFCDLPVASISMRVVGKDRSSLEHHLAGTASVDVQQVLPGDAEDVFRLALRDSMLEVTPTRQADSMRLAGELGAGRVPLARLSNPAPDGSVDLSIAFFAGSPLEMGDLEIGCDEYVHEGAQRIAGGGVMRDVYSWMAGQCTYVHGGEAYFFLSAGPAIKEVLDALDEPQSPGGGDLAAPGASELEAAGLRSRLHEQRGPKTNANARNSFCIMGTNLRFVATTATLPGGASIYVAKKLTALPQNHDRTIRLAKGKLQFRDWTKTGQIRLQAKAQLEFLAKDESSYLRKWDEFGDLEGEQLLRAARQVGAIRFSDPRHSRDGTVLVRIVAATHVDDEALGRLKEVDVVEEEPSYLVDHNLTFASFRGELEAGLGDKRRGWSCEVVRYARESRNLALKPALPTEPLPKTGFIIMSMVGDLTQIKRRAWARKDILEGRSANPQLGLLIEERGEVTSLRLPCKIKGLTDFVRRKVFKSPPTEKQIQAIEVALNTPDIALIQGPPGTGKTTVIAAIVERLNEIATKEGRQGPGYVLLSGFQHVAVDHMIAQMNPNGVPVPKFGRRAGDAKDGPAQFEQRLEEWCADVVRKLKERYPELAEATAERRIKDLHKQYLDAPTRRMGVALLRALESVDTATLGEGVARRVDALKRHFTREENASHVAHLPAVRRLRARPESFADDGPERAQEALADLAGILDEKQASLLASAADWPPGRGAPPFLVELVELKRSLLVQCTAPPVFRVEKHNDALLDLANEALDVIMRKNRTSRDQRAAALAEFCGELENNPHGMSEAISEFSFAYAATAQQSVGMDMSRRKRLDDSDGSQAGLVYPYVIVDEAARVSPRDLMIPMSQGRKIILVGDHRQLPHIIQEQLEQHFEDGAGEADELGWLKKSMFEYLFSERLRVLEGNDGIPRRVTLDTQFRMHPELGSFVSRNFYERFDAGERFGSGLEAEQFQHHLPGTGNKPAMWIPVPASAGRERRDGKSWVREAEVDVITDQLKAWVESPQGCDMSYGIISYYRSQAELIRRKFRGSRNVHVGTVDAFQGMEFDVVFLSLVRTARGDQAPAQGAREAAGRRYGRLCSSNLLNVSMSRQKRLLVVVGDPDIVSGQLAMEHIPGLVAFHRLVAGQRA